MYVCAYVHVYTHLCIPLGWTPRNGIVGLRDTLSSSAGPVCTAEQAVRSFPAFYQQGLLPVSMPPKQGQLALHLTCIIFFTSEVGSLFV